MAYIVELSGRAERQLGALPARTQARIVTALRKLALDPYRAANVKKVVGDTAYRLRVIYEVRDDRLLVLVVRIAHRREAYRRRR